MSDDDNDNRGDAAYLRCKHCKGFYETSFARCKWCDYDDPVRERDGSAKIYPDRETCRAIQFAEFEQLPPEVRSEPMGPPRGEPTLLCNCLHCGPDGHTFEAIEMRWMANEQMWACPCTTCGGRGFGIDIHSAENRWQCAECGHFYTPANNNYRHDNACCPKCGSTLANGWFDSGDETYDEDDEDDDFETDAPVGAGEPVADEELPWDDDDDDDDDDDEGFEADLNPDRRLRDDIDFPYTPPPDGDIDIKEDDIPF